MFGARSAGFSQGVNLLSSKEDQILSQFIAAIGDRTARIEEHTAKVRFLLFPPFEIDWGDKTGFSSLKPRGAPVDTKDFYNLADAVDYARDRWKIEPAMWQRGEHERAREEDTLHSNH